jgi:hydroxyacylglutathione hydrolase
MTSSSFLIHQFEDKPLAHFSYAICSQGEMILIDPSRNPQPYYDFAKKNEAKIVGVVETHPHADFVSSHLEIHKTTGATIYASKLVGASYPHLGFDENQTLQLGAITLKCLHTPGHSPDSISIVASFDGKDIAVFSGDTLFIGDCGRPDLRENAGAITATRESLAKDMYHSLQTKYLTLADDVVLYPTHGAGTLCGKGLKEANSSTIGEERKTNWCLQPQSEENFVASLIAEQPFVPIYFEYDVAMNKQGMDDFASSILSIPRLEEISCEGCLDKLNPEILIVDTRPPAIYKDGHFENAINIPVGGKFETWLGSVVAPKEPFYLVADSESQLDVLLERIAKIGYENAVVGALVGLYCAVKEDILSLEDFTKNKDNYTILDIRNTSEVVEKKLFEHSIAIPLANLRARIGEIPLDKPILVHCAGGYRSAIGSSILKSKLAHTPVYDLGEAVSSFY